MNEEFFGSEDRLVSNEELMRLGAFASLRALDASVYRTRRNPSLDLAPPALRTGRRRVFKLSSVRAWIARRGTHEEFVPQARIGRPKKRQQIDNQRRRVLADQSTDLDGSKK